MAEFKIPQGTQQFMQDIQPEELRYHKKRVAITKVFTFDAAHHMHNYAGKCISLHGHTYRLEITISGYPNEIGMSIDFGQIKKIYTEVLEDKLDHRYLNETLPKMNTSVENVIVWIWEQIDAWLIDNGLKAEGFRIEELKLAETPNSWGTMKREWMEEA
ncbi:6-carboxytetrahydropterin synthase QueD [Brevibacillus dissolubilis]|uniref:6-carboxytetrahydropterin synthase QueD n=1 Tax=Brevibacillus dissolubilis TaxID=1844116 RepID=UPI001116BE71|nr:6-carboxytetrahydropterin synthase QueD [Brevibacillus dissolubilis]